MKKILEDINISGAHEGKSKVTAFFQKQKNRLRHGSFTCPFCREVFSGLSAMGSHLKDHCR